MCPKMAHYQTLLPSAERVVRDRELALIGARKPFLSRLRKSAGHPQILKKCGLLLEKEIQRQFPQGREGFGQLREGLRVLASRSKCWDEVHGALPPWWGEPPAKRPRGEC